MKGVIEITVKFIFEKVPSVNNGGNVAKFVKAKREMLNATPLLPYVEGRSIEVLILNYNSARDCGNEFRVQGHNRCSQGDMLQGRQVCP